MKKIIILVFVLSSGISSYAQKTHGSQPSNKVDTNRVVYTCPMHHEVINDIPGKCPKCGMELVKKHQATSPKIIYTCSMHPEIQSDKPGNCPKCGMKLVEKKIIEKEKKKKNGMGEMKMGDM